MLPDIRYREDDLVWCKVMLLVREDDLVVCNLVEVDLIPSQQDIEAESWVPTEYESLGIDVEYASTSLRHNRGAASNRVS